MKKIGGADIDDVDVRVGDQFVLACSHRGKAVFPGDLLCLGGICGAYAGNFRLKGKLLVKVREILHAKGVNLAHRAKAAKPDSEFLFHDCLLFGGAPGISRAEKSNIILLYLILG